MLRLLGLFGNFCILPDFNIITNYMYKVFSLDIEVAYVSGIIIKEVANFMGKKTVYRPIAFMVHCARNTITDGQLVM